jgi:hypothetical protein
VVAAVDAALVRAGRTHEQVVVTFVEGDVRTRTMQLDRGGSAEEPAADDRDPHLIDSIVIQEMSTVGGCRSMSSK